MLKLKVNEIDIEVEEGLKLILDQLLSHEPHKETTMRIKENDF